MRDFDVMDGALAAAAGATLLGIVLIPVLLVAAVAGVGWLIYRAVRAIVEFVRDRRAASSWEDEANYVAGSRAEAICDLVDLHRQTLTRMDRIARDDLIEGKGREVRR